MTDADEVKSRIDIVDFVGTYATLKKAGRNYKALCPFHSEKTPSFIVSPDRQTWHCFGSCKEGGDVIKFLMKWENITFLEALKELAEKAGVKLKKTNFEDREYKLKEKLFTLNLLAEEYFHFVLTKHAFGKKALEYLKNRGISEKLINTFKLGYAPASWDSLMKFLKKRGFSEPDLVEAGLVVKTDRGTVYDRFRSRLIFPLKDSRGNVLGFSGRILTGEKEAKYVNTSETAIYHKRQTLFGIDITKDAIKEKGGVVIVEGEFDMLSLFKHGIPNVVAIKGSAVTKEQLTLLKRYTNRLILALDADASGIETTKKAIEEAEKLDFELFVAQYDFAKDPDEAITKEPEKFKKIIEKPKVVYDFIIDTALKKYQADDPFAKKHIAGEVVPYLMTIQNPIVKDHYIAKIANLLDIEKYSIEKLLRQETLIQKKKQHIVPTPKKTSETSRIELIQRYILSVLLQSETPKNTYENITAVLEYDDFSIVAFSKILQAIGQFLNTHQNIDVAIWIKQLSQKLEKELLPAFDELVMFDISVVDLSIQEEEFTKVLYIYKRLSLKQKIKDNMQLVGGEKQEIEVTSLLKKLSAVEKKLIIL